MPIAIRKLIARGYWNEANDGATGGGGGGGGTPDSGNAGNQDDGNTSDDGKSGDDGKKGNKPTDAEAKLLQEVMDKKNKLKAANEQLEQVNARLKQFEGLDPDQIKALLKEAEDRKIKSLEEKGAWEQLKKQLVELHTAELTAKEAAAAAAQAEAEALKSKIGELTVGNAFGQSKFIATEMALPIAKVRTLFGSHFEFDGEKVVAYDKPAGAKNRVVLVDKQGDPLNFEAAIAKLVEADSDRESLLKSKMKPGAGSGTENRAKPSTSQFEATGVNRIQQALANRKK